MPGRPHPGPPYGFGSQRSTQVQPPAVRLCRRWRDEIHVAHQRLAEGRFHEEAGHGEPVELGTGDGGFLLGFVDAWPGVEQAGS